jgi:hypothetical protein
VLVSYVASENASEHGGLGLELASVNCTVPRISVRIPVAPALKNGSRAEEIWPDAIVNAVALPIRLPPEL